MVSLEEAIKLISDNDVEGYMERYPIGRIREDGNFWIFAFIPPTFGESRMVLPGPSYKYIVNKSTGKITSPGSAPTREELEIWNNSTIVYEKDEYYSDEDEDENDPAASLPE